MIFIIGGTLAFFFEFLLLSKKDKSLADKLLAVWMLMIGLHLFLVYYSFSGLDFKYTFLLGIGTPFPFLHAPTLFLYTAAITGRINKFKLIYLLHYIPFVFFYCYYATFFVMAPADKIAFAQSFRHGYSDLYIKYSYPAMIILAITYLTATFLMLRKHERNLKEYFSYSSEKINLHWLRNLFIGLSIVWVVVIISNRFFKDFHPDYIIYSTVVLFVISIGYFGIKQGDIFISPKEITQIPEKQYEKHETKEEIIEKRANNPEYNEENPEIEEKEVKRYAKSGLKEEDAIKMQKELSAIMKEKKLFLDEGLTLNKLAEELKILPNYLSQVINEKFNKNFYDFVNSYRVEEFKMLVQKKENKKKTLLALAFDSGFTSKASFNSFFKKLSGQTPSEYVKSFENSAHLQNK